MPHGIPTQKIYLFSDLRHILCSDLQWLDTDGLPLPLLPQSTAMEPVTTPSQMPYGLRLVAQKATKTDSLPPLPWPRSRNIYDGGVYRAWGLWHNHHDSGPNTFELCCSESNDMFEWRLVHSCTLPAPGSGAVESPHVFIDPHAPPAERYKAIYCAGPPREQWPQLFAEYTRLHWHHRIWRMNENFVFAMYGLVSPDGLEWTPLPDHLLMNYGDAPEEK